MPNYQCGLCKFIHRAYITEPNFADNPCFKKAQSSSILIFDGGKTAHITCANFTRTSRSNFTKPRHTPWWLGGWWSKAEKGE